MTAAQHEADYRTIFEATSDGLVVNDPETGVIIEANTAFCRMHGYTREELIGRHPSVIVHPDYLAVLPAYFASSLRGEPFRVHAVDIRKDGTPFHIEVHGVRFVYQGRACVLGVVRDVTEQEETRRLLEQRVEERTRELTSLLDVSRILSSTLELRPLLSLIMDQLYVVADFTGGSVVMLEGDTLRIVEERITTLRPGEVAAVEDLRFSVHAAGPLWQRMLAGEPTIIRDVRSDEPAAIAYRAVLGPALELPAFRDIRAWLGVPLKSAERVIGLISMSHVRPGHFTAHHARIALAVAAQAAAAIENSRLYEQARDLAALEERARLARDLHDSVTQSLFSLTMLANAAQAQHARGTPALATTLQRIGQLAQASLTEMRALLFDLRPRVLSESGLAAALEQLASLARERNDAPVNAVVRSGREVRLPAAMETAIFRIAQEALNNALKHAAASAITISLEHDGGVLRVTVSDDGAGFVPDAPAPGKAGGLGMRSMRERATALGLALIIESAPGAGTRVSISTAL